MGSSMQYIFYYINNNLYQKKGGIMCVILEKIQGKSPEELLQEYGISPIPPINVSLLLQRIGIREVPMDFSEIEDICKINRGDVLGIIYAKSDSLTILYKATDTLNRKRFTLAHEIAHCCLNADTLKETHIELRSVQTATTPKEINANIFAGALLIPKSSIERVHSQFIGVPDINDLAKIFNVSTTVMAARLRYLNLPFMSDNEVTED